MKNKTKFSNFSLSQRTNCITQKSHLRKLKACPVTVARPCRHSNRRYIRNRHKERIWFHIDKTYKLIGGFRRRFTAVYTNCDRERQKKKKIEKRFWKSGATNYTYCGSGAAHRLVFYYLFFSFYIDQAVRFARLTGPSRLNRAIYRKLYTTI